MNRLSMDRQPKRDPRPGRPSAEEIKKTTERIGKKPATSSTPRKGWSPQETRRA